MGPRRKPSQDRVGFAVEHGVDVEGRVVYLVGDVDEAVVVRFLAALHVLDAEESPVRVILSSDGGGVDAGMAIYDAIRTTRSRVTVDCYGACQSIAALILQAADVRRVSPECRLMIHNGSVRVENTSADTMESIGREVALLNRRYWEILARRSGLTTDRIKEMCQVETYLSAAEAVEAGLADEVIRASSGMMGKRTRGRRYRK
jgi:ATP-dependent Clp protease protease subunit